MRTAKPDWRETTLARMRALILEADPGMTEERKWIKPSNPAGVPVWSHHGMVCTGETYANVVKLTFARGASLPDPSRLFNASLEGNSRRAIAWVLLALQLLSMVIGAIRRAVSTPAHPVDLDAGFSINGWLAVLLTFLLARVFAEGARMREDLEGTV